MGGAKALVEAGAPIARSTVIGEPTNMRPVKMHKGIMIEKLTVTGRSGHSSNPELGNNAMESMQRILGQLMALRAGQGVRGRGHERPVVGRRRQLVQLHAPTPWITS